MELHKTESVQENTQLHLHTVFIQEKILALGEMVGASQQIIKVLQKN